jgi:hypothetical protein
MTIEEYYLNHIGEASVGCVYGRALILEYDDEYFILTENRFCKVSGSDSIERLKKYES